MNKRNSYKKNLLGFTSQLQDFGISQNSDESLTFQNTLYLDQDLYVTGVIHGTVDGTINTDNVHITGTLEVDEESTFTGDVEMQNLNVEGTATFNQTVIINHEVYQTDAVDITCPNTLTKIPLSISATGTGTKIISVTDTDNSTTFSVNNNCDVQASGNLTINDITTNTISSVNSSISTLNSNVSTNTSDITGLSNTKMDKAGGIFTGNVSFRNSNSDDIIRFWPNGNTQVGVPEFDIIGGVAGMNQVTASTGVFDNLVVKNSGGTEIPLYTRSTNEYNINGVSVNNDSEIECSKLTVSGAFGDLTLNNDGLGGCALGVTSVTSLNTSGVITCDSLEANSIDCGSLTVFEGNIGAINYNGSGYIHCANDIVSNYGTSNNSLNTLATTSATHTSDISSLQSGKFDNPTGTTAQYIRGNGSLATFPTIPSGSMADLNNVFNNCVYVSAVNGNDSNDGYCEQSAKLTLASACSVAGNSGRSVAIFAGTYSETSTITQQNITITSVNYEKGGICNFSGTITINSVGSVRILGLAFNNLIISGSGVTTLQGCKINGTLTKSGSGYVEISDCDLQGASGTATVSITGAGQFAVMNSTKMGLLTVNNAGALVSCVGCSTSSPITLTSGYLALSTMPIFAISFGHAITATGGAIIISDCSCLNPDLTLATISFNSSVLYSFRNFIYNVGSSTNTGVRNSTILYSDALNTTSLNVNGTVITNVGSGSSSGDAVNKSQLDTKLNLSGGTMSGNIAMGNNKLTGLTAGSSSGDSCTYGQFNSATTVLTNAIGAINDKVGSADGICPLDSNSKVDTAYLPEAILGSLNYKGQYSVVSNSPTLSNSDTGKKGWFYILSDSGSRNFGGGSITFTQGDWVLNDDTAWTKVDATDQVSSVFGRTGVITATNGDYTASQITNTPAGNISAVTVQNAINELDTEKQPLNSILTSIAGTTPSNGVLTYNSGSYSWGAGGGFTSPWKALIRFSFYSSGGYQFGSCTRFDGGTSLSVNNNSGTPGATTINIWRVSAGLFRIWDGSTQIFNTFPNTRQKVSAVVTKTNGINTSPFYWNTDENGTNYQLDLTTYINGNATDVSEFQCDMYVYY